MLKQFESIPLQIIELLSIRPPPVEVKMKLLKEIAEEHEIDWDPSATETEYLKPHEDLLVSVCIPETKVSPLFFISLCHMFPFIRMDLPTSVVQHFLFQRRNMRKL